MNLRLICSVMILGTVTAISKARADDEMVNAVCVFAAKYGAYYAKSVPSENHGPKGETRVYRGTLEKDKLEATYPWYSPSIYMQNTYKGTSVIRIGDSLRGHAASKDDVAIGFYLDGKVLKEYSTLDIAGKPENVSRSVSHYSVVKKVTGYRWLKENDYVFDIETQDDRLLSFDVVTGELVATAKAADGPSEMLAIQVTVKQALEELGSIKPGMTRADLLKICRTEGGISSRTQRTYIYRGTGMIKVDVTFKFAGDEQDKIHEHDADEIRTISKPYLAWAVAD